MARRSHTVQLVLNARDRTGGVLGRFRGTLGRIAEFAVGGLLVGGLQRTAQAISAIGRSAIEAVGNAQTLEMGLQGLLTEALMYERAADGIYHQTLSFGNASELAAGQVKGLLSYIEQTAIISPFETTQVEQVARIGLAARLSADQVKDFTGAFLDYSAVHGITSSNLSFAAEQFLQLKQAGALTTIDLRQLRRLGIDISRIIGTDMSMSLEEATARFGELSPAARGVFEGMDLDVQAFNAAAADSPEMIDAIFQKFILLSEEGTAGAAERMAGTVTGMISTFKDVGEVGARKLFRPLVEAVSPTISGVLERLSALATGPEIEELGQRVAQNFTRGLEGIKALIEGDLGMAFANFGAIVKDIFGPEAAERFMALRPKIEELSTWVGTNLPLAADKLKLAWDTVLKPALEGLGALARDIAGPAMVALGAAVLVTIAPLVALGVALVGLGLLWKTHGEVVRVTMSQIPLVVAFGVNRAATAVRQGFFIIKYAIMNTLNAASQAIRTAVTDFISTWRSNLEMARAIVEALRDRAVAALGRIADGMASLVLRVARFVDTWRRKFADARAVVEGFRGRVRAAFDGIAGAIGRVISKIGDLISKVRNIELPDFLTPGSPTPFELGLRGIAAAMRNVSQAAVPQFSAALATQGAQGAHVGAPVQGGQSILSSLQGDTFNITVNDQGAAALLMAMIEDRRRERLNLGMRMT